MNKVVIGIFVIGSISVITIVFILPQLRKPTSFQRPVLDIKISPTQGMANKTKTYNDPAGFSFSYPENFVVTKEESIDEETYSSLYLTPPTGEAKIEINLKTSDVESLDEIVNIRNGPERSIQEVLLADLHGKQTIAATNIDTYALDDGVLISINTFTSNQFDVMKKVHEKIVGSFKFVSPATLNDSSDTGAPSDEGSEVEYEGEEVIE